MSESMPGIGILGISPTRGWAATAHMPALRALPNYEIRALSAQSAESARAMAALAAEHGARTAVRLQARQAPAIGFLSTTLVGLSVPGNGVVQANAYMLDSTNRANLLTIAVGHGLDTLNCVPGGFADLSAVSGLRRPLITIEETGEQIVKTAPDQIAVIGTHTVPDFADAVARHEPIAAIGRSAASGERVKT